jgi:8-oxo-dGTP diphosphatase
MKERNIATALECYIKKDGKYLMLHRHPTKRLMPNVWMAPGGKLEPGEGLYECTRREVLEETGLEIKNLKIKAVGTAYLEDLNQEMYFHFLTAEWLSGEVTAESDVGELVWLTPQEILNLDNLLAELTHVLPFVFDETSGIISYKARYDVGNHMTEIVFEDPS